MGSDAEDLAGEASIPEFGDPEPGQNYTLRPGAYAIIQDEAGSIALVRTPEGLFLPGGGQDEGESLEEALVREVLEECGLRVRARECVGTADELCCVRGKHVRKRCTFFRAALLEGETVPPVEADHEPIWLSGREALTQLSHESQKWALRRLDFR